MAAVRDPAFWKRFSMAVHLDEEQAASQPSTPAIGLSRPGLKHADSWLERQQAKKIKSRWTICMSVFGFAALITIIILVLVWLGRHDWFSHGEKFSIP